MSYRVIITGCRNWKCHALATRVVKRLEARFGGITIVHGSAPGVDSAFHDAAIWAEVGVEPHPADWDAHGKKAGPLRNAEMIAKGANIVIAVHRDLAGSKGTKDCVRQAMKAGIPCYLIDSEDGEPRRIKEAPA